MYSIVSGITISQTKVVIRSTSYPHNTCVECCIHCQDGGISDFTTELFNIV